MDSKTYKRTFNELFSIYVGKYIRYDDEIVQIKALYIERRENAQHMNRAMIEGGNVVFLNEIDKLYTKEEIEHERSFTNTK